VVELTDWIAEAQSRGAVIVGKRLSANDTGATGAHQAGPYVTRSVVDEVFAEMLGLEGVENPKSLVHTSFSSHLVATQDVTLTWYNNRLRDGTRNEFRLTGWGGKSSPMLNPDSTGSLALFAFERPRSGTFVCDVWLCRSLVEEEVTEASLGSVDPGEMTVLFSPGNTVSAVQQTLESVLIPSTWVGEFPTAQELVAESVKRVPGRTVGIDRLLVQRRALEYDLFRQVEDSVALPRIKGGFTTLDEFIQFAGSLTNRRKARSGRSLELQLVDLFVRAGVQFDHGPVIESGKRPDFLFPSVAAYNDPGLQGERLTMLAVKTTCKDRWRQILNEASRIPNKHLLTLQEGVSEGQYAEMVEAHVILVVPEPLHEKYPKSVRASLLTLQDFIDHLLSLETLATPGHAG
jgi:hypothetical protein